MFFAVRSGGALVSDAFDAVGVAGSLLFFASFLALFGAAVCLVAGLGLRVFGVRQPLRLKIALALGVTTPFALLGLIFWFLSQPMNFG